MNLPEKVSQAQRTRPAGRTSSGAPCGRRQRATMLRWAVFSLIDALGAFLQMFAMGPRAWLVGAIITAAIALVCWALPGPVCRMRAEHAHKRCAHSWLGRKCDEKLRAALERCEPR